MVDSGDSEGLALRTGPFKLVTTEPIALEAIRLLTIKARRI